MSTVVAALLVMMGLSVPGLAEQQDQAKAQGESVSGPHIEITPQAHDFGKVKQNEVLVKEFEIRNVGGEELKIGRISTSCGCTAALTSEKVVPPGEKTTLKVTLETRSYKGPVQRSVSIASNDPRRVTTIKVKAFVEEPSEPVKN